MAAEDGKGKRRSTSRPRAKKSATVAAKQDEPVTAVERATESAVRPRPPLPSGDELGRLLAGEHGSPHSILGAHPVTLGGQRGILVRALAANATRVQCLLDDGTVVELEREAEGLSDLYGAFIAKATLPL